MHVSEQQYTMLLSLWRTFIPYLVGFFGAQTAKYGLDIDEASLESFLVLSFGTVYYAVSRFMEQHVSKRWGWLLGYAKQPLYLRGRHRRRTARETPTQVPDETKTEENA
jgi:hypothetical protein